VIAFLPIGIAQGGAATQSESPLQQGETMATLLTSVGALAIASIALAFPATAKPKGGDLGQCFNLCNHLPYGSLARCERYCLEKYPPATAAASVRHKPKPRPTMATGAPARSKQSR
jgi:hypothetical protein